MTKLHSCILPLLAAAAAFGLTACSTTGDNVASVGKIARKGDVIKVRTTAYTHNEPDHKRYGAKNAVGTQLRDRGICSAAADWSRIPYGTKFKIIQTGETYMVDDYGSALVGTNTIDLYKPSYRAMNDWGVRQVDIKILSIGSYSQSAAILAPRRKYDHVDKMARVMEKRKVQKANSIPMQSPTKVKPDTTPLYKPAPSPVVNPTGYYYASANAPKRQPAAAPAPASEVYYAAASPKKPGKSSVTYASTKKRVHAGPGVPAPALAAANM